jgi:hypothetical protein
VQGKSQRLFFESVTLRPPFQIDHLHLHPFGLGVTHKLFQLGMQCRLALPGQADTWENIEFFDASDHLLECIQGHKALLRGLLSRAEAAKCVAAVGQFYIYVAFTYLLYDGPLVGQTTLLNMQLYRINIYIHIRNVFH